MASALATVKWLYTEFGISSLYHTGRDAWLIILSRSCRMFAFGATSLIIALFFSELDFSDFQIGLFMTLTLVGDVLLSLVLTVVADAVGRRRVLLLGAGMMVASGAAFAVFENFWILLLAAVVGVISATGTDFGPFRAVEESVLSHITTARTRSDVLSWYVAASSLGSAVGTEASGRMVDWFRRRDGWEITDAYHAVFWLYIAMGLVCVGCALTISEKAEIVQDVPQAESANREASQNLLGRGGDAESHDSETRNPKDISKAKSSGIWGHFASIKPSQTIMRLWFLLTVDSLADGMASYSLTNYYIDRKFQPSKSTLGDIMSISFLLIFPGTIFAGPLAKRIGLVNTMVFTHVPSSLAVLLFPVGHSLALTTMLLFVRTGLNNMDQAPRVALIAAIVRPEERTAVMGITSTFRTLGSTIGPTLTGSLAESDRFWIAFVVAGALRLAYDFGLWAMFTGVKVDDNDDERKDGALASERISDEEDASFELESLHSDSDEDPPKGSL